MYLHNFYHHGISNFEKKGRGSWTCRIQSWRCPSCSISGVTQKVNSKLQCTVSKQSLYLDNGLSVLFALVVLLSPSYSCL